MGKILVASKGYTIEVTSWEKDGGNYDTKKMVVQDKEYAVAVLQMCKDIFCSCNNGGSGIGNMSNGYYGGGEHNRAGKVILKYIENNPIVAKGETRPYFIVDMIMDVNYDLMGSSEYYYSRVFESGCVYYSNEDIYLEVI